MVGKIQEVRYHENRESRAEEEHFRKGITGQKRVTSERAAEILDNFGMEDNVVQKKPAMKAIAGKEPLAAIEDAPTESG
eukprot:11188155-Alexandrium_andersonii.AAC.1